MSYEDFKNYLLKYKYVIVNISAVWCKPCISLKPQIEKFVSVIDNSDYIYLKLDNAIYEEESEFNTFFNLKKIPYFACIKNGKINDAFVSSELPFVSKKIFDFISKERIEETKKYESLDKTDDF
jgi:thioredoxin-like negative regulator of GroEL